ncbi:unnamed protein product [Moneuplotes crassus]|uniref:BZIP domain-containing protein n=1 Tax=Euplotes crassus TaxID=5936 RepID=A0AAD1XMC0_EUPCR|nr:unnamed protein product [Moneuplotes crassus]
MTQKKEPKTNKERSRQHRVRKKKFIEDTITECAELRKQVKQLQQENSTLKEIIKAGSNNTDPRGPQTRQKSQFESRLHEYEDYTYNNIYKKMIADPKEVRYTELEQIMEHVCEWSDDRVDYIKTCFKKILNSMVSQSSKCFYACNNILPANSWNSKSNLRKRAKKYFNKSSEQNEAKEIFSNIELSAHAKYSFKCHNKDLKQLHKKFKKIGQNLIKQRNKLLNLYQDIKDYAENCKFSGSYSKIDVVNDFLVLDKVKETDLIQDHKFYDIPKKNHTNARYEEGELTE